MWDAKSFDDLSGSTSGLNDLLAEANVSLDLGNYQLFARQKFSQSWIPSLELTGVIVDSLRESTEILKQAVSDILSATCYIDEVEIQNEASSGCISSAGCKSPPETAKRKYEFRQIRHIRQTNSQKLNWENSVHTIDGDDSSVEKIMAIISANEGSAETINWDDNGCGISVGAFQANQKYGELPLLLSRMQNSYPQLFEEMFGKAFANLIVQEPQLVRNLKFTDSLHKAPNQLGSLLQASLQRKEFQQTQWDMLREKVLWSRQVAMAFGINSEKGVALVADMINQLGLGNDNCGAKHYLKFALGKYSEKDKLEAIIAHDHKSNGRSSRDRRILNNFALSAEQPFKI